MPTLSRFALPLFFAGLAATSQAAVQNIDVSTWRRHRL